MLKYSPDQPRDDHGRFADAGGELAARLKESGGFTYQPIMNASPQTGYALSILPGNERVLEGDISADQIGQYIDQHAQLFQDNTAAHVGGWLDAETGKVYLDVSVVEPNLERALDMARAHNQLAIYDLSKHETIRVPERLPEAASQAYPLRFSRRRHGEGDRRSTGPPQGTARERFIAMKLSHVGCSLQEVKFQQAAAQAGTFSGYGAIFGNTDSYDDVIAKGAFKNSLKAWKAKGSLPKMLLQHGGFLGPAEDGIPIGQWTNMEEDDTGLVVEGQLFALDTQKGKYIYAGLKSGALDGLSIGYIPIGIKYGKTPDDPERTLTEIDLLECSVVTFPANDVARVDEVKSELFGRIEQLDKLSDFEGFLRDAGFPRKKAVKFVSRLKKRLHQSDSDGHDVLRAANEAVRGLLSTVNKR